MMSNYYMKCKVNVMWNWNGVFHCMSESKMGPGYCLHLPPPVQIISNDASVIDGYVPIPGLILQSGEVYRKSETYSASWGFVFVTLYAKSDLEMCCDAFPTVCQTYI